MLEALNLRFKQVQQELQKAKQTIDVLTEQLEKQKINFHVITGHANELSFQIKEVQKLKDPVEPFTEQQNTMEQCDGQADIDEA